MVITDVCNLALSHLGKGVIKNIHDDTETAKTCKLYYDHTRKMLLREYPWGFARRVERLAQVADKHLPGWRYIYMYPELAVQIHRIHDDTPSDLEREYYEVVNLDNSTKVIATNLADAWVDYLYDVTDPDVWDSVFLEAFTRKLAADMCMRLVGNQGLWQQQYQLYREAMQVATTKVAMERERKLEPARRYVKARFE